MTQPAALSAVSRNTTDCAAAGSSITLENVTPKNSRTSRKSPATPTIRSIRTETVASMRSPFRFDASMAAFTTSPPTAPAGMKILEKRPMNTSRIVSYQETFKSLPIRNFQRTPVNVI